MTSPLSFVHKKNDSLRPCVDLSRLNSVISHFVYASRLERSVTQWCELARPQSTRHPVHRWRKCCSATNLPPLLSSGRSWDFTGNSRSISYRFLHKCRCRLVEIQICLLGTIHTNRDVKVLAGTKNKRNAITYWSRQLSSRLCTSFRGSEQLSSLNAWAFECTIITGPFLVSKTGYTWCLAHLDSRIMPYHLRGGLWRRKSA